MNRIRYNSLSRFADIVCDFPNQDYLGYGLDIMHNKEPLTSLPEVAPYSKIFIKTDLIPALSAQLREINVPVHLLTGSSDITIHPGLLEFIVQNKNILSWTGQNLIKFDERFLQVPIGFQELGSGRPNSSFVFPEPLEEKTIPIVLTPVSMTTVFRSSVTSISGPNILNVQDRLDYPDYVNLLNSSKYSICPPGNGVDTHRVIESIKMKSKPIVLRSILDPMFTEIGCEIVNSWEDIVNIDLDEPTNIDTKYTTFGYWAERIYSHQKFFKE